ncbi:MAG: hypothetical protein ACYTG6_06125 [Planctomycetota bacterium]|jgi:hypothetical protein
MTMQRVLLPLMVVLVAVGSPAAGEDEPGRPCDRVILVLLGGGRLEEMSDAERMPALTALAEDGFAVALEAAVDRPHAASVELLTGRTPDVTSAAHERPRHPTLFELTRHARDLPREQVWFVSHEGGDALRLAHSLDPAFGVSAAPSVAHGDGAFGEPLHPVLASFGRPLPTEEEAWRVLRGLRVRSRQAVGPWLPKEVDAATPEAERLERAVLRELDRRAALVRGPNPRDQRALRSAMTVLDVHRPVLTVVRLGDLRGAGEERAERLAATDRSLAAFRTFVAADPALASGTAVLVVGETPPPRSVSEGTRRVLLVGAGAGLRTTRRRGERPAPTVRDLAPTVLQLLGVDATAASGRVLDEILAGN